MKVSTVTIPWVSPTWALVGILTLGLLVTFTLTPRNAAAEPNEHASCVAHEMEGISPPGSSDEFPGGAPQLLHEVVLPLEGPGGAVVSFVAKLHEGSHEACDETLE